MKKIGDSTVSPETALIAANECFVKFVSAFPFDRIYCIERIVVDEWPDATFFIVNQNYYSDLFTLESMDNLQVNDDK